MTIDLEQSVARLTEFETRTLREQEIEAARQAELAKVPQDITIYLEQIKQQNIREEILKKQLNDLAKNSNQIHNGQQNQLQGIEKVRLFDADD